MRLACRQVHGGVFAVLPRTEPFMHTTNPIRCWIPGFHSGPNTAVFTGETIMIVLCEWNPGLLDLKIKSVSPLLTPCHPLFDPKSHLVPSSCHPSNLLAFQIHFQNFIFWAQTMKRILSSMGTIKTQLIAKAQRLGSVPRRLVLRHKSFIIYVLSNNPKDKISKSYWKASIVHRE